MSFPFKKRLFLFILSFSSIIAPLSPLRAAPPAPPPLVQESVYPLVILGGGIGGLTSALYLGRAGVSHLVVEGSSPGGAIAQSPGVQNWPGEKEISGGELVEKIHKQAESNGTQFLSEEVVSVDFSKRPFTITTRDPYQKEKIRKIQAHACIIAMGSSPNLLGVKGEKTYWTKGVYSCAVCDGALFKDQTVVVVGGGDAAMIEAQYLSHIAKKVILLVRGESFRTSEEMRKKEVLSKPNVEVRLHTTVEEIKGDGKRVTHLQINEKGTLKEISADGVFLAIGATPNTALFKDVLEMDSRGYLLLKDKQETSIKGVYAVGDIADPDFKQAVSASGDGAKAALQAERYLGNVTLPSKRETLNVSQESSFSKDAIEITSLEQFEKELHESPLPILVDFYATWCGPCKHLSPFFEAAAKAHPGKAKFLKVNVDKFQGLAIKYDVRAMPTLLILNQRGDVVQKKMGSYEIIEILNNIEQIRSFK